MPNNRTSQASKTTAFNDLREKAGEVGDDLRDMAGIAVDAGREQVDRLKDIAVDGYEEGRDQLEQWYEGLERTIRKQPMKSLLIAAGIGLVMGAFWRRL